MLPKADSLYSNPIRDVPPCKDCPDRHIACHDSCEKYGKWKAEIERVKAERNKYDKLPWNRPY